MIKHDAAAPPPSPCCKANDAARCPHNDTNFPRGCRKYEPQRAEIEARRLAIARKTLGDSGSITPRVIGAPSPAGGGAHPQCKLCDGHHPTEGWAYSWAAGDCFELSDWAKTPAPAPAPASAPPPAGERTGGGIDWPRIEQAVRDQVGDWDDFTSDVAQAAIKADRAAREIGKAADGVGGEGARQVDNPAPHASSSQKGPGTSDNSPSLPRGGIAGETGVGNVANPEGEPDRASRSSPSSPSSPSSAPALLPCPFCGEHLKVRAHSAFHPENWCWLATADENGNAYELDEHDYEDWNRRAPPPSSAPDEIEGLVGEWNKLTKGRPSVANKYVDHVHDAGNRMAAALAKLKGERDANAEHARLANANQDSSARALKSITAERDKLVEANLRYAASQAEATVACARRRCATMQRDRDEAEADRDRLAEQLREARAKLEAIKERAANVWFFIGTPTLTHEKAKSWNLLLSEITGQPPGPPVPPAPPARRFA